MAPNARIFIAYIHYITATTARSWTSTNWYVFNIGTDKQSTHHNNHVSQTAQYYVQNITATATDKEEQVVHNIDQHFAIVLPTINDQ